MKRLSLILGVMLLFSIGAFAESVGEMDNASVQGFTVRTLPQMTWRGGDHSDYDRMPTAIYLGSSENMGNDNLVPNSLIFQPNDSADRP